MAHYFDTGIMVGDGSWHGQEVELDWAGGVVPRGEPLTVRDAMKRSGMLYPVYKLPIGVQLPPTDVSYERVVAGEVEPAGHMQLEDKYAIMRPPVAYDDGWANLRTVGNRYEVIQNEQLAEIMEDLAKDWPVETVLSLKGGRVIVVTLKTEPFEVGGKPDELHETYLMVANDHSEGGINKKKVRTRVVCSNTYAMSLGDQGGTLINIPHTQGGIEELQFRVALQEAAIQSDKQEKEFLNTLFTRRVTGDEVNEVITAALPDTKVGRYTRVVLDSLDEMNLSVEPDDDEFYEKALAEVEDERFAAMLRRAQSESPTFDSNFKLNEKRRKEMAEKYVKFNDEHDYAQETAYALFQGITDFATHSETYTGSDGKNAISLLFGQRDGVVQKGRKALVDLL